MDRPGTALLLKGTVVGRVPITSRDDGQPSAEEKPNVVIDGLDNLVPAGNPQCSTWAEIHLQIGQQQH